MPTPARLAPLLGLSLAASVICASASPSSAAAGDAFDPSRAQIFIAQGTPNTQLSVAVPGADGNFSFVDEGPAAPVNYNGLVYDTADNYLYGFVTGNPTASLPLGAVIRIGQEGTITRVGTATYPIGTSSFNVAAFADGRIYATITTGSQLFVIDPSDGTQDGPAIPLSTSLNSVGRVSDWTFSRGYLWGMGDGKSMARVDPDSGQVDTFTMPFAMDGGFAGAAWTNLDGTLGFSHNDSGAITRIAVADPSSASPSFSLVSSRTGPPNLSNDGAANPGLPADLSITKTSEGFAAGGTVTYTLKVTNEGDGFSTGWTATDDVPSALSGITATSSSASCSVAGQVVTCVGGELSPGDSATVTVTAEVPADFTGRVTNTASVVGNEPDPDPSNDRASVVDRIGSEPTDPSPSAGGDDGGVGPGDGNNPSVPANPVVTAGGQGVLPANDGGGTPLWQWLTAGLALVAGSGAVLRAKRTR